MIEINGKGVSEGAVMGKLFFIRRDAKKVRRVKISDIEGELERLASARRAADVRLSELYDKALSEVGDAEAQIFQIHRLMLEDEDFCAVIENTIKSQSVNAEYAVSYAADLYAATFEDMEGEYMKARAADVKDAAGRLCAALDGGQNASDMPTEPVIVVADDLAPSETVGFDREMLLGFVTFFGSQSSHTAILARTMGIPAVIGTGDISSENDGATAILNGTRGEVCIEPSNEKIEEFKTEKRLLRERKRALSELRGKPTETRGGQKIRLFANIGAPSDMAAVLQNDAEGIGLLRSEFLYMEKRELPTEEEQFREYKEIAERMGGRCVVVRTMDIGADKAAECLGLRNEGNPALGYRAIRICLTETEMFKTQLRAILRASAYGKVAVMFPMIISVSEVREAKKLLEEAKRELAEDGVSFDEKMETGIMIETPAAAVMSDELAAEADFFSIGTNDLTQYTLAIDRQNSSVEAFFDPHHEAVLRLIEMTVSAAHRHGKWVGICGELGADTELTERFVRMGVDELSVSPSAVLRVREKIRGLK